MALELVVVVAVLVLLELVEVVIVEVTCAVPPATAQRRGEVVATGRGKTFPTLLQNLLLRWLV